jgi:hypothetical protein
MPAQIQVVEATRDHAFANWRGVFLYVWRGNATPAGIEVFRRTLSRVPSDGGPGVALGYIEPSAPSPDGETRKAIGNIMGELGKEKLRVSATVFEGEGFTAATVRFVATSMSLIARNPFPHKLFPRLDDAARWTNQQLVGMGLPAYPEKDLVEAMNALRATRPA